MTTKELISLLQAFPQNAEVFVSDGKSKQPVLSLNMSEDDLHLYVADEDFVYVLRDYNVDGTVGEISFKHKTGKLGSATFVIVSEDEIAGKVTIQLTISYDFGVTKVCNRSYDLVYDRRGIITMTGAVRMLSDCLGVKVYC